MQVENAGSKSEWLSLRFVVNFRVRRLIARALKHQGDKRRLDMVARELSDTAVSGNRTLAMLTN